MRISVFGLGYVGCVSAACLAQLGHDVIGVDVNSSKVALINSGRSPLAESGLEETIRSMLLRARLRATTDSEEAIQNSELSLICVGTPSNGNGSIKLQYLENVCIEIGTYLKNLDRFHTIVVRSAVLPETGEHRLIPLIEKVSGRKHGLDFGYAMNPEFLREGSAVWDFHHPSQIVIGVLDAHSTSEVERLYAGLAAPIAATSIKAAEMISMSANAFHALDRPHYC